jgi:thiol-disulfide isomerase/thioredoxin
MRRFIVVAIVVLVVAIGYRSYGGAETGTGTLTLQQPAPTQGESAPRFQQKDIDGKPFEISDDGVYVLMFWSTLNQGSNKARPGFEKLAREYSDDGATFAAVYVGSVPSDNDKPYGILQDSRGSLTSRYNIKRVPRVFVIKDGTITAVQNEYFDEYIEDLETEIQEALGQEPGK